MFWSIVFLIGWGLIFLIVNHNDAPAARALRRRIWSLLGMNLITSGYFFLAWIRFDFLNYLSLPFFEWLNLAWLQDIITSLGRFLPGSGPMISNLLQNLTRLNGWQIQLIPTLHPWTRLASLLPLLVTMVAFLLILINFASKKAADGLARIVMVSSLLAFIFLILRLPDLDALSLQSHFEWAVLSALLGAQLGGGPWICAIGLLILAVDSIIAINTPDQIESAYPQESEWSTQPY